MESQKRPRSDDNDNDTSISKKFPRIATPIRSETKEAVKRLLSERKKKAERVEIKKFDEIQNKNRPIARTLLNHLVNIWIAAPNYLRHAGVHNLERAASM